MKTKFILCLLVCSLGFVGVASAIAEEQRGLIVDHCETIRDNLRNVQKLDARARVFLGSHYEAVLSKFITPLNVRLVENNMSDVDLIENQNSFAAAKAAFVADFINYQQELEGLVAIDCKHEPERFYEHLKAAREKRKIVAGDLVKMRSLVLRNIALVKGLREGLK